MRERINLRLIIIIILCTYSFLFEHSTTVIGDILNAIGIGSVIILLSSNRIIVSSHVLIFARRAHCVTLNATRDLRAKASRFSFHRKRSLSLSFSLALPRDMKSQC